MTTGGYRYYGSPGCFAPRRLRGIGISARLSTAKDLA